MTFSRATRSELIEQARADFASRLPGADSRVRRNVIDVLIKTQATAIDSLYEALASYARFFPDPDNRESIERWAALKGLTRKSAVAASGAATIGGTNGATVLAGAVLIRADGARYLSSDDATIVDGMAAMPIVAEQPGADGEMVTGQPLTFVSPVAGINAVALVAAPGLAGALDEESDADLSSRVYETLRNPPAGGKASDYVAWAKRVAGVTRAWVTENWDGLGTVRVLFVLDGRDDIIPLTADIAAVSAAIASERPVCADVTVAAPSAAPLDLTIAATPATDAVKAAIEASLRDLIAREAEPGGTLLISHIREAISTAAGETDHVLSAPTANVVAAADEITTLGSITWS